MIDLTQTISISDLMVAVGTMQKDLNEAIASKDMWYEAFFQAEAELKKLKESARVCNCAIGGSK